jgi:hypothetical protein
MVLWTRATGWSIGLPWTSHGERAARLPELGVIPDFVLKLSTHCMCAQEPLFHRYGQKVFIGLPNVTNKV